MGMGHILAVIRCDVSQDKVRQMDSWTLLFSASRASPRAREMVWQFTLEKWEVFKERFAGQFLLSRIIDVRLYPLPWIQMSCDLSL